MSASYFDVDGTLIRTNLVHPTLFYLANQASPGRSLKRLAGALWRSPRLALAELRDRRTFNEQLFSLYEGVTEDRLLLLADEVFDTIIRPGLHPGAKDLVSTCRDRGHEVVLLSGSLDFLMDRLAKHIGAQTVIANRLEISRGAATGRILPPIVAGPSKAVLLREHAKSHNYDLSDCFAYSDSLSDVPMLSVVGHASAVNPDGPLEALARAHHWAILHLDRTP